MINEWTDVMKRRFAKLHRQTPELSFTTIASMMSAEFGIELTRNACIGKARRLGLATRDNIPRAIIEKRRVKRMKTRVDAPVPPVEAERTFEGPEGLDIYQLRDGDCHWPLGKMSDLPPFRYCGGPAVLGRPYCSKHARRAYNTVKS